MAMSCPAMMRPMVRLRLTEPTEVRPFCRSLVSSVTTNRPRWYWSSQLRVAWRSEGRRRPTSSAVAVASALAISTMRSSVISPSSSSRASS